jgi:hypothetical protein
VYLGNGYVLTAWHVGNAAIGPVKLGNGITYAADNTFPAVRLQNTFTGPFVVDPNSDLKLFKILGVPSSVPDVRLTTGSPGLGGENALIVSYGINRQATTTTFIANVDYNPAFGGSPISETGYRWGGASNFEQYGRNLIEPGLFGLDIDGDTDIDIAAFSTDFDSPAALGAQADESQGALGDSGGGIFVKRGGLWELSGIINVVDGLVNPAGNARVQAAIYDSVTFDSRTYYSDLSFYQGQFSGLIPEPTSAALLGVGVALVLKRRIRA